MILQKVVWPRAGICAEEKMYFHNTFRDGDKIYRMSREGLRLKDGATVCFDTYFNGFSVKKWMQYTCVKQVSLSLELKGRMIVSLCKKMIVAGEVIRQELYCEEIKAKERGVYQFEFPETDEGMIYFEIRAISDDVKIYHGYYEDKTIQKPLRNIVLGLDICTFRREKYIEKNIFLLNQYILNNPGSVLKNALEVFVIDNGKTLDAKQLSGEHIHIVANKNNGGAGGFTRGLIEMMDEKYSKLITHALLMDDDVIIDPEALEKTYVVLSLLKEEYVDAMIGGAMLRSDKQNIQVESGASWNAGHLISNKANFDLSKTKACIFNEYEEYTEYNAWWYCCIPMTVVSEDNLPLPLFVRGDDLEYGLRNKKKIILMNGICVWHEPFENKYSSVLEYYIIRNRLVDNALHFPMWGKAQLLRTIWGYWKIQCKLFRYQNIDLYIKGIQDFLTGVDFFKKTDGEKLHQALMSMGYKLCDVNELAIPFHYERFMSQTKKCVGKKGRLMSVLTLYGYLYPGKEQTVVPMNGLDARTLWKTKTLINYDPVSEKGFKCTRSFSQAVKCGFRMFALSMKILFVYDKAKKEYQRRIKELQQIDFWRKYLEM